jgi:phospholipid transport system substrate-binding protein
MNRRALLAGLLALAAPGLGPGARAAEPDAESARRLVQDTTNRMLTVLKAERQTLRERPGRIYDLVNEIILPHFDFSRMSRWVLGKHWRAASAPQRERFVAEFRNLLVRTYATALLEYADQSVEVLPMRGDARATDVVVRTEVRQPGALPIPIQYSMTAEGGDWKVYDVVIDGVSLVASYRSTFGNEIARAGMDGLITTLEARNRELAR